ncbi:MAG: succinyl-diaminopimelate desuccinylase [Candidatus Sericytochromatia bacterium]|nr:succinyl-diaminopimelate desuccinylase [Candidatus Sericytochromatia bacterium]
MQAQPADLAALTLGYCAIPSVTGNERALCDALEAQLGALTPELGLQRVAGGLVARGPARPGRPTVGLFGHLDTVRPADDQPLEVRDGRVFGCGASDMKGGLAVMVGLLQASLAIASCNVVAVFYDKEEGPASDNGLEPMFLAGGIPAIDFGVCLEPTDNRIQVGCVGGLHALVTFRGRRAHSARPWQGENALHKAAGLLGRLQARQPVGVRFGELEFHEVITATTAATTNSRNVVPDAFTLNVNVRFAPGRTAQEAHRELCELVAGEAEVIVVDEAPAGGVCLDHPWVQAWRAATGLPVEPKQAWTDVARLTARGIPAVNFGPGETAQAHQARESIAIADMDANLAALSQLLETVKAPGLPD